MSSSYTQSGTYSGSGQYTTTEAYTTEQSQSGAYTEAESNEYTTEQSQSGAYTESGAYTTDGAYTSYGEGSGTDRSKSSAGGGRRGGGGGDGKGSDEYSYSEGEGEGEGEYYDDEYYDDDEYSGEEGEDASKGWLERASDIAMASAMAVSNRIKKEVDDLLDPNRGTVFTPRGQAPPKRIGRAAQDRAQSIAWRELVQYKEDLLDKMAEAEAVERALDEGVVDARAANATRQRLREKGAELEARAASLEPSVKALEQQLLAGRASAEAEAAPLRAELESVRRESDRIMDASPGGEGAGELRELQEAARRAVTHTALLRAEVAQLETLPRSAAAWRQRAATTQRALTHALHEFEWARPPPRDRPTTRLARWARMQRGARLQMRTRAVDASANGGGGGGGGGQTETRETAVWAQLSVTASAPTLELRAAAADGSAGAANPSAPPLATLELAAVTMAELGVAALLGRTRPSPQQLLALDASLSFSLLPLRGAPLHLRAADRAQLELWWFGTLSLASTPPRACHLSAGALLWRLARLRYAERRQAGLLGVAGGASSQKEGSPMSKFLDQ